MKRVKKAKPTAVKKRAKPARAKAGKGSRSKAAPDRKPKAGNARTAGRRPAGKPARPAMGQEEMQAAWQKSMTPGAGHRRLDPLVGSWSTRTTFTMTPDAPPQVSEGASEHRWILGGRYLEQSYKGMAMGMPFEGVGYTGYDNAQGKYVGTWMDSFGTGLMDSVGVGKPSDSAIDFEARSFDPFGKKVRHHCRVLIQDRDHHSYEIWAKTPEGRRYRWMLVEYTRR